MTGGSGLGRAASRGVIFTMGGQAVRILVQLLSVVILSRLLAPSDFGLVAMVLAIVGVAEVFRDFGLTQAAVQAPSLSHQQKSNLFWINTGIGVLLALLAFGASWPIAMFYGEERLTLLTQVISVVFVINGVGTQLRAQLSRDLKFGVISAADTLAPALSLLAAIGAASMGVGYWALAVQQISGAFFAFVVVAVAARWTPSRYRRGHDMRGFLRFGGFLVLAQLVTYASKNIDSVVIGARLGATELGLYNRAFQILLVPLNQINAPATRVALPVLSRLQEEKNRFDRYLLTAQSILLQPVVAGFALVAALAEPLISLILGEGWGATVPIFQILALAGVAQTASSASYWVFLARGRTKSQLYWALCSRPIIIGAVIVGSFFGLHGVAWGYALGNLVVWPLGLLWVAKLAEAPALRMFGNGVRAMLIYGLAGLSAYLVYVGLGGVMLSFVAAVLAFLAIVALAAVVLPRYRADLGALVSLLPARFRRRRS